MSSFNSDFRVFSSKSLLHLFWKYLFLTSSKMISLHPKCHVEKVVKRWLKFIILSAENVAQRKRCTRKNCAKYLKLVWHFLHSTFCFATFDEYKLREQYFSIHNFFQPESLETFNKLISTTYATFSSHFHIFF